MPNAIVTTSPPRHRGDQGIATASLTIGLIAFLTVVDLFATQALLPTLTEHYHVSRAAMGLAVNASTAGMAVSGLATALMSRRIRRREGVAACLGLLAIPTALLALAPDLATFAMLRVVQGILMAAAFTLTLAYLGEECSASQAAGAFAAYITGNVASNLLGRLLAAALAGRFGLDANFYVFAGLNLAGAVLAYRALGSMRMMMADHPSGTSLSALGRHLAAPDLRWGFTIGFAILFVFIGIFTYVNFVLVAPPLSLQPMQLGLVYIVFLPSIVTTPLAGRAISALGIRGTLVLGLLTAAVSLPLLLSASLEVVLVGLALAGCGTFLAQATATGYVSRTAKTDRGAASGLYLACYFLGGITGAALLGAIFDMWGWPATVLAIGVALAFAVVGATRIADAAET